MSEFAEAPSETTQSDTPETGAEKAELARFRAIMAGVLPPDEPAAPPVDQDVNLVAVHEVEQPAAEVVEGEAGFAPAPGRAPSRCRRM